MKRIKWGKGEKRKRKKMMQGKKEKRNRRAK